MRPTLALCGFWCLLATSLLTAHAAAQTPDTSIEPLNLTAATTTDVFATAVDAETLSAYRGGNVHVRNDMALTGTTADNTAQHVNTGNNAISAGAFSNMSGMPVVIQNSGANVLIQNAVILNLQMN